LFGGDAELLDNDVADFFFDGFFGHGYCGYRIRLHE
jgi:hypothetical protein